MTLLLVFLLEILDKRSTFSREKTETKLHWSFCDNEKEVLPRFELGSLDSESKVLTTTPENLLKPLLVFSLKFLDQRSIFSRGIKQRRNYTEGFVTMKKRFYRDLNSGLWIQSPRC